MIHHWKAIDLEIAGFEYHHDLTSSCEIVPSKPQTLKYVEIIKFSDKRTYDTSLERS